MKPIDIFADLKSNTYPGRGIVIGKSADGRHAVAAYFIMGRSENSRNRVFEETEDGIRTKAFDESKMTDPSLIIYHPVRRMDNGVTIVTNGDQTDTIRKHMLEGHCYRHGLHTRTFEPDPPLYTPRISGIIDYKSGGYWLSILKSTGGDPAAAQRQFFDYEPLPGLGHFIHTYKCDGDPVPSFEGEPKPVAIEGDIDRFTAGLWESLNQDNKVSLFVRYIDLESGKAETRILNKNQ